MSCDHITYIYNLRTPRYNSVPTGVLPLSFFSSDTRSPRMFSKPYFRARTKRVPGLQVWLGQCRCHEMRRDA